MSFSYENQQLGIKHKEFSSLAHLLEGREEPCYVYDLDGIEARVKLFKKSFKCNIKVYYAVKANNHKTLLEKMNKLSVGADVVSAGEAREALEAGIPANRIIFSGVGKTRKEIEFAIDKEIHQINIESSQELERIIEIATHKKKKVSVALRINPDVDAKTHPYISTGFKENKFGLDETQLLKVKSLLKENQDHVELKALTIHIGSQLYDLKPIKEAILKTRVTYDSLKAEGFPLERFDIGGGLGVDYNHGNLAEDEERIRTYGKMVTEIFKDFDGEVQCEPGRVLVSRFGLLLGQVQYIKESEFKNFAILNTGMHHLMRPCLYQAYHRILPLEEKDSKKVLYDIVGPICESSDVLGYDRLLPELEQDDWLAVADAGAYGKVMASNYNSHGEIKEYIYSNGRFLS